MKIIPFLFFLTFLTYYSSAQDTLILNSGRTIIVKDVQIGGYQISYHRQTEGAKQKKINLEKVFSLKYHDGNEHVFYQPDSLEEDDFTPDQMRMYIRGEQDAMKYYKNNTNKIAALVSGGAVSYFGFYGIIGPAIYSTIVGAFSPDVEKQPFLDPALVHVEEYKDGFQRKVRDKKIKDSILYGLLGFAAGVVTYSVATHN